MPLAAARALIGAASARRMLVLAAGVPYVVFLLFSPFTPIQPNWPVIGVLPALVLLAEWLARGLALPARRRAMQAVIVGGAVLGSTMVLAMRNTDALVPVFAWLARNAPPWELTPAAKWDPTVRLRGWSQLGAAVGDVLREQRAAGRDPFILADDYQLASALAFYCPGQPRTYCASAVLGGRRSQYDIWPNPVSNPAPFIGRPVIYVGSLSPALTGEGGRHAALPGLRRVRLVEHQVHGTTLRMWGVFVSDGFAGFR